MKKDSFILYTEINDVVKELSDEQKGKLFQAILDYEESGDVPEMDTLIKCVFIPIKRDLDKNDEKWRETSKKRSEAGKKGMQNRYNKDSESVTNDNNVITNDNIVKTEITKLTDNEHEHDNEHEDEHDNVNQNPIARARTPSDARFEIFWQTYPKKVDKLKAEKAFMEANISAELFDRIIKAIGEAKESEQWTKDGGQYIPNPANWLAQARWEDELPRKKTKANFKQRDRTEDDYEKIELQLLQKRREA